MSLVALVRYGTIPEVSRFAADGVGPLSRGDDVIVQSHRGLQQGVVLNDLVGNVSAAATWNGTGERSEGESLPVVVRRATEDDRERDRRLREAARAAFDVWRERIDEWELELELIDVEWTADEKKLILYVLNGRGPDYTKLALQAAAAGLGIVEVQPVTAEGLVVSPAHSGGCGTCGCH